MALELKPKQSGQAARRAAATSVQVPLDKRRHNLPNQLTSFVGRASQIAGVEQALEITRLLTLTGAGGIGKTRLALAVGADLQDAYRDGVWLVELAQLTEPTLVPRAAASPLGVAEEGNRPLLDSLADHLRDRHLLLILDNCEHLVSACAELAECILRTCPDLRILATSREALGVGGEAIWRVPALSMPFFQGLPPVARLKQYESTQLFLERATAVAPGFTLTDRNAAAVAQICHRLDGIPLAIELAAARVKVLSPEQIAARLDDRFSLLTGGSRTALPRYKTLRGLVDWSYALLAEPERTLFRRLSVFAGSWTLEAAEAICAFGAGPGVGSRESGREILPPAPDSRLPTPENVLDLLQALVDKSLVLVDERAGAARYRLLETLRQYAAEKLRESGEESDVRHRQLEWSASFAERTASLLSGPRQAEAFDALEEEHDNLRAALDWSRQESSGWEAGVRIADALSWFWVLRGYRREGLAWLGQLLSVVPDRTPARAKLLVAAGLLTHWDVDPAAAETHLEAGLHLWRELDDRRGIAAALARLGQLRKALGDYDGAWELLQESAALSRDVGGEGDPSGPPAILLAQVAKERGDYARAEPLFEESLALARERGDPHSAASALRSLAELRQLRGANEEAVDLCRESLVLLRELGDKPCSANALEQIGSLALAQGRARRAARLFSAARSLDQATGRGVVPTRRAALESALTATQAALGEGGFAEAWSQGQEMEYHQAVEYALAGLTGRPAATASRKQAPGAGCANPLTAREREITALIARGLQNRQIGAELVISERTVESHVAHILGKLGFTSRTQIATWATEQELLGAASHSPAP